MPEGDSIHKLAKALERAIVGREVRAFSAHDIPDANASALVGRAVTAVEARGKNLLIAFEGDAVLHVHLRMLGRVRIESAATYRARTTYRAARRPSVGLGSRRLPTAQLVLAVGAAVVTGHRIPVLRLLTQAEVRRSPDLVSLGPDLLAPSFDAAEAERRLRALAPREIGDALLVQRAVAGIGNVYKSEVLFLEGIHPRVDVVALSGDALARLLARARVLLAANLGRGPRRTRSSLRGPRLWVYGRTGRPCLRCGASIERHLQGAAPGRATFHCPRCQPAPAEALVHSPRDR